MEKFLATFGRGVGKIVGTLYQAGRESIDQVLKNILPFMAFISLVIGIVVYTGLNNAVAGALAPLAGSLIGLLVICVVCSIPFWSPLLGPGAVIAQVTATLLGSTLIANGSVAPSMALPALFAINPQVGCDFIPVGLALGEAEPETVEIGVPAILFSRMITGPIAVILAWLASFGLYS